MIQGHNSSQTYTALCRLRPPSLLCGHSPHQPQITGPSLPCSLSQNDLSTSGVRCIPPHTAYPKTPHWLWNSESKRPWEDSEHRCGSKFLTHHWEKNGLLAEQRHTQNIKFWKKYLSVHICIESGTKKELMLKEGHLTSSLVKLCRDFIFSNKHVSFGHCKAHTSGIFPWALKRSPCEDLEETSDALSALAFLVLSTQCLWLWLWSQRNEKGRGGRERRSWMCVVTWTGDTEPENELHVSSPLLEAHSLS